MRSNAVKRKIVARVFFAKTGKLTKTGNVSASDGIDNCARR